MRSTRDRPNPMMTFVDTPHVELRPLDETWLPAVLEAAVEGADPCEVMPPVPGADGWTAVQQDTFLRFLRDRTASRDDGGGEILHVVLVDARAAGVARLRTRPGGLDVEAGLWLARWARGRGVGTVVLGTLSDDAEGAGAARLVADTTQGNAAAIAALTRLGAELRTGHDDVVSAELELPRPPASTVGRT